jgi:hypothetical protein
MTSDWNRRKQEELDPSLQIPDEIIDFLEDPVAKGRALVMGKFKGSYSNMSSQGMVNFVQTKAKASKADIQNEIRSITEEIGNLDHLNDNLKESHSSRKSLLAPVISEYQSIEADLKNKQVQLDEKTSGRKVFEKKLKDMAP